MRNRRPSEMLALTGSAVVVLLFIVAWLGLGMNGMYKLGRLRVTPATVGLSLLPIPAIAWVFVLWSRSMPSPAMRALRLVCSIILLILSALSVALTLFVLLIQPTPRAS
jgi:hypothetical protein